MFWFKTLWTNEDQNQKYLSLLKIWSSFTISNDRRKLTLLYFLISFYNFCLAEKIAKFFSYQDPFTLSAFVFYLLLKITYMSGLELAYNVHLVLFYFARCLYTWNIVKWYHTNTKSFKIYKHIKEEHRWWFSI